MRQKRGDHYDQFTPDAYRALQGAHETVNEYKQRVRGTPMDLTKEDEYNVPLWLQCNPFEPVKFDTPQQLWDAAVNYFHWATENPIRDPKRGYSMGKTYTLNDVKPRAFTFKAFCAFCGCSERMVAALRAKEEYATVLDAIDQIMYAQKFEYASTNIMNANLIARELKISENVDLGGRDNPIRTLDVTKLSEKAMEEILNAQKTQDEDE